MTSLPSDVIRFETSSALGLTRSYGTQSHAGNAITLTPGAKNASAVSNSLRRRSSRATWRCSPGPVSRSAAFVISAMTRASNPSGTPETIVRDPGISLDILAVGPRNAVKPVEGADISYEMSELRLFNGA